MFWLYVILPADKHKQSPPMQLSQMLHLAAETKENFIPDLNKFIIATKLDIGTWI